jgi:desulfoferrodoxin-like iron-binding protein
MSTQAGKRYRCTECGGEVIVTKGGAGSLMCCGRPMEER